MASHFAVPNCEFSVTLASVRRFVVPNPYVTGKVEGRAEDFLACQAMIKHTRPDESKLATPIMV
jgi:hypothetical protein